ncbi:cilia BBSome complex subunit 10 domain-containing protein [Phthorimaea operculella]|nr:cilia BBSome complex subunit 10 domain-containing protein [Phthorimaea operculella]
MSETSESTQQRFIDFDPILPDAGTLFYEECPAEFEIERPKLLPLKTATQIRFEELQHEAARVWREKQRTAKTKTAKPE